MLAQHRLRTLRPDVLPSRGLVCGQAKSDLGPDLLRAVYAPRRKKGTSHRDRPLPWRAVRAGLPRQPFLTAGDGNLRFEFGLSVLVAGLAALKDWSLEA